MLSNGIHIEDDRENRGSNKYTDKTNKTFKALRVNANRDRNKVNPSSENESVFKSANWFSNSELIFSLSNQVGGLVRALRIFQELDIGIKHVESRKSKRRESEFEIFVDIDCSDKEKMKKLVHHLR